MRPFRLALAAAATLVLGAGVAQGQAAIVQYAYGGKTFVAVDAVSIQNQSVVVTGVLQGESAPSSWRVYGHYSNDYVGWAALCQRSALMAMASPGKYLLEIRQTGNYDGSTCTLSRVNP
jgi:hypothetical protein